MDMKIKIFKVKTQSGNGFIRAEWSPEKQNNSRLYSGCGNTVKEAISSLINMIYDGDLILEESTVE